MKNNLEIALKISSDLMTYCYHHGATQYDTKITEGDESIAYVVKAYPVEISDKDMKDLKKRLSAPRQRDVEHEYWELLGESEDYSELMLIAMSSDEAIVEYENKTITFTLLREY